MAHISFTPNLQRHLDVPELDVAAFPAAEGTDGPPVEMIWCLEPGGPDQPGTLWAGTVLERGLPQQLCYDLVYRHGLDVDGSGQGLAMGSTTGHLWVSEDQGDSWQLMAGHLPPIFAVRFG